MQFQKFSRFFVATITCITFFLSSFGSFTAFATSTSNDSDFWHGFYVEHITKEISGTGVDVGNADSTDYGISTGNYIYNKSGITTQDIIDYVSDQYSNATGYVVESTSDYVDKVNNVLNRAIDGTLSAGYKAEKALRTVVDSTGNVFYNVSSSDYWNGVYNRWFNNGGYNDQYASSGYDGYNVSSTNGISYNINYVGIGGTAGNSSEWCSGKDDINANTSNTSGSFCFSITNSNGGYAYFQSNRGWGFTSWNNKPVNLQYSYSGNQIYVSWQFEKSDHSGFWNDNAVVQVYDQTFVSGENTQTPVLQPSQVGFIQYPLGGKTPIYTDTSLNPTDWIINDNGTVTVDGNDYPALIDEKEIDDNGWLDMLNLLDGEDSREMSLKDPWGAPWETQDDGTALGGFFGNLVKDIQKMFKGIGNKIKEIFQKPIDVLSDLVDKIKTALTEFFTFSPDDLNVDVSFNFDILESIWDAFLEQFGLE